MDAASSITRTVVVNAPRSAVWEAITDPDKISQWFGQRTSLDLRVGGKVAFTWDEYGTARAVITEVDEPNVFGFRWAADTDVDPAIGNSTLVRFTLSEHASGTELTVVETGFDTLDREVADQKQAREANVQGWHIELDELVTYLHGVKA
ncbi:SRPBCC family protein [Rhodococcus sp. NPDC049939]|uniref:SRPBCC family protein n=1 Tax=Rhodococcus sp. NPDC049939 TaxID=3155511 RepID=UPI0034004ADB